MYRKCANYYNVTICYMYVDTNLVSYSISILIYLIYVLCIISWRLEKSSF